MFGHDGLRGEELPLVNIKQLELRGFKSFGPKKMTFNLEKGLTVFTGPNGSGKSNIFDAIRFVLGDLRARSLRASKMSEVIFDGVLGTPSSRSAYVKLVFNNRDRKIPLDTDVVTLLRRVNRKGFSKYALNGRTVSRSQLVDILGMARLYSSGYNMIIQGTITKLADITPEERRRVIEDFVGIAEYNAKRSEARQQLRQAETNLRIADARIGDVQYRLERLEEERNDALRYNFIQKEIRKLQAILTSHAISEIEGERMKLADELQQKLSAVEGVKDRRDNLQRRRREVESARRRFDEEVTDKGSVRLRTIQTRIGEIMASMASLKMENTSGTISLRGLTKIREERVQQLASLKKEIQESKRSLSELKVERNKLKKDLDETSLKDTVLTNELTELKQNLGNNAAKMRRLEAELNKEERQVFKLDNQLKTNGVKQRMVTNNLKNLEKRRTTFGVMMTNLEAHLHELQRLQKEEQERFAKTADSLQKTLGRKEELPLEIEDAEKTVGVARSAIVEFQARKMLIEQLTTEDAALQRIEEMGQTGAIPGIIGSLENLVKFEAKYRKALDVAASGWLKAVVVTDLMTALQCVESLKKMKIGRIKIIPLREVTEVEAREPTNGTGVIGLAAELVKCDEKYRGVVNFIFGDTVVTTGEKSAFLASKDGFRAVDLSGGLYEAGGGIESGFYRSPINISSLLPSEVAVGGLTKSVQSLERMLVKRKRDVDDLSNEVMELREEQVKRLDIINTITRDINLISENIKRTKQNVRTINKRTKRLNTNFEQGKTVQSQLRSQRTLNLKSLRSLRSQKKKLDVAVDRSNVDTYEYEQTQLNAKVNELNRRFIKIENDVDFLETKLNSTLQPEHERVKLDIQTLRSQINSLNRNVTTAQSRLGEATKQLAELEKSKELLSESLTSVKGQRMDFERRLDEIDLQLKKVSQEYEKLMKSIHTIDLEVQRKSLEGESLRNELLQLGHKTPVPVDVKEVKSLEAPLELMRFEFDQLGSVNQLAPPHYDEQQRNYKQLSVRRNQLEGERKAILVFIDEVEQKKRAVFSDAYDRVNESFSLFFERLTGGGQGWLSLENPENPFTGGIDIFVQFPGKASRLIASASGGEKSVVAVAFIFAIQSLSPAAFYVFDEIDAHLDPYNAERLADLLKEQSSNSQFIVITLRDVVIDRAEKLFGVYIQRGISQIVSTKMEEVLAQVV
jgi:chromosome segregation protein